MTGVGSSNPGGSYHPLDTPQCSSPDGFNWVSSGDQPPPLLQLQNSIPSTTGAFTDQSRDTGFGSQMTDTAAGAGALILPMSYGGPAQLSGPMNDPLFTMPSYTSDDVANSYPDKIAGYLNRQVKSIEAVWPNVPIVIVGHSNGGLVAELWWIYFGSKEGNNVVQAFALDSPLNGVANPLCETGLCGIENVGQVLGVTYKSYWRHQAKLDPRYVGLGDRSPLFTAVGTLGDPVYDAADVVAAPAFGVRNIGLTSQVYFSEPSCQDAGFDLSSPACTVVGRSLLDPCGPLFDYGPPFFGLPGDVNLHGVVRNCPGVIGYVMRYVTPTTGIPYP